MKNVLVIKIIALCTVALIAHSSSTAQQAVLTNDANPGSGDHVFGAGTTVGDALYYYGVLDSDRRVFRYSFMDNTTSAASSTTDFNIEPIFPADSKEPIFVTDNNIYEIDSLNGTVSVAASLPNVFREASSIAVSGSMVAIADENEFDGGAIYIYDRLTNEVQNPVDGIPVGFDDLSVSISEEYAAYLLINGLGRLSLDTATTGLISMASGGKVDATTVITDCPCLAPAGFYVFSGVIGYTCDNTSYVYSILLNESVAIVGEASILDIQRAKNGLLINSAIMFNEDTGEASTFQNNPYDGFIDQELGLFVSVDRFSKEVIVSDGSTTSEDLYTGLGDNVLPTNSFAEVQAIEHINGKSYLLFKNDFTESTIIEIDHDNKFASILFGPFDTARGQTDDARVFASNGGKLYFSYDDATVGQELFFFDLSTISSSDNSISNANSSIELFPNPCSDYLIVNVEKEGATSYSILDGTGAIAREGQLQNDASRIDVSTLPLGQYFISINGPDGLGIRNNMPFVKM